MAKLPQLVQYFFVWAKFHSTGLFISGIMMVCAFLIRNLETKKYRHALFSSKFQSIFASSKVNDRHNRTTSKICFIHISVVSTIDFEQVNTGWNLEMKYSKQTFKDLSNEWFLRAKCFKILAIFVFELILTNQKGLVILPSLFIWIGVQKEILKKNLFYM